MSASMLAAHNAIPMQHQNSNQDSSPQHYGRNEGMSSLENIASGDAGDTDTRKLVILGLPWDTTEASLEQHFSQIGPLQEVVIMKDRTTGKSRGFGFVTFQQASDAAHAGNKEHMVDGRRCEAKYALPRGGGPAPRTTRIFVARIPPVVSDVEFRQYFERFGQVQDAYMPKDASKQSHRGIGFVTFSSSDSVEAVMSTPHSLNGQELAIDRATPKEKGNTAATAAQMKQQIHQLAAAAAAAASAYPAALAQLAAASSGAFSPEFAAASALAAGGAGAVLPYGAPGSNMTYSAAVNGFGGRPGMDGSAGDAGRDYARFTGRGSGAMPTSSGGSGGGQLGYEQSSAGQGDMFQPLRRDGSDPRGADEQHRSPDLTGSPLHDYSLVPGGEHTAQAFQGLTFGGNGSGIGIGLGMLQQQQQAAHTQGFQVQGSMMLDADAQAQASQILRSLSAPQARSAMAAASGLSDAQIAGLLAGNVDAAQLVNSIVNGGGILPSMPAPARPPHRPPARSHGGYSSVKSNLEPRSGPRIFVGKLNKETTESDVKVLDVLPGIIASDYFKNFGYVMDVYLPRDKVNRSEHRGFGFVTFETEGAVMRISQHGQHQIRGSMVAIDSAVPRREEGTRTDDDMSASSMQVMDLAAAEDPSLGPARNHPQERLRHGYKPY